MDITELGLDVTLISGDATARKLDEIGDKGEKAGKRLKDSFNSVELQLIQDIRRAQEYQQSLSEMAGSLSRIEQHIVRQADETRRISAAEREAAAARKADVEAMRQQIALGQQMANEIGRERQMILAHAEAIEIDARAMKDREASERRMALLQMEAIEMDAARSSGLTATGVAAKAAHGSFGQLNQELVTTIKNATGTEAVVAQLGYALSNHFVASGGTMLAVLGGLALLSYGYEKLTEDSRKAKEEQDKLTESLREWYRTQQEGEAGVRSRQVAASSRAIAGYESEVSTLERTRGTGGFIAGGVNAKRIAELKRLIEEEKRIVAAGRADIDRLWEQGFIAERGAQAAALASRLQYNAKDEDARRQALDLLKQDQALYAQYLALPASAENSQRIADYAQQIGTLRDALKPTELQASELRSKLDELAAALPDLEAGFASLVPSIATVNRLWADQVSAAAYLVRAQDEIKKSLDAIAKANEASARKGVDASAAGIMHDPRAAQETARAIQQSVGAAADLAEAFKLVDQTLADALRSIGQIAANIDPLIGQIKALRNGTGGSIGGVISSALPIVGGIVSLTKSLFGGAEAARQRREAEEQLRRSYDQSIASIKNQVGDISDVDYAKLRVQSEFDEYRKQAADLQNPIFKAFGYTATTYKERLKQLDDLQQRRTKQIEEEAAAMKEAAAAAAALRNTNAINSAQMRIYSANGDSGSAIALQNQLEIDAAFADGLSDLAIAAIKQAQAAEAAQREREKQTQLLQDQLSTAQQSYDSLKQVYGSLSQFSDSLKISQYSPLSPRQQLDAARGQLNTLYQAALGGDQSAASQFSGVAQQFLESSRRYNASGAGYVLDYNSVSVMTDALKQSYAGRLTDTERQIDLLNKQLATLQQINLGIGAIVSEGFGLPTPTAPVPSNTGPTYRPPRSGPVNSGATDIVAAIEVLTKRVDGLVSVSQEGFRLSIAATSDVADRVEETGTDTRRGLESVSSAMSRVRAFG